MSDTEKLRLKAKDLIKNSIGRYKADPNDLANARCRGYIEMANTLEAITYREAADYCQEIRADHMAEIYGILARPGKEQAG